MFSQNRKEDFKKHHIAKAINGQNLAETDTISANKQIEAVLLVNPKKIVETRAGFLAIEVRDKMQSMPYIALDCESSESRSESRRSYEPN